MTEATSITHNNNAVSGSGYSEYSTKAWNSKKATRNCMQGHAHDATFAAITYSKKYVISRYRIT